MSTIPKDLEPKKIVGPPAPKGPLPSEEKKLKRDQTADVRDAFAVETAKLDPTLAVLSVKDTMGLGEAAAAAAGDALPSSFPIDDLGEIKTHDRWAQGFRLDGGSVRLMLVTARRVEQEGKPGFEIFFQAHGNALARFRKRMEQNGSEAMTGFEFFKADVDSTAGEGKHRLRREKEKWSPSSTKGQRLEVPGKYTVEMCGAQPEAIKGAVRIRVFGEDAHATDSFKEVVGKLGLHGVFSPPTPASLEKFKLFRLAWVVAPEAAKALGWHHSVELDPKQIQDMIAASDIDPEGPDLKAIDEADVEKDANIARRIHLAELLLKKSPPQFFQWVKEDYYNKNGILPGNNESADNTLNEALAKVGAAKGSPEYRAAEEKPPPNPDEALSLLELGLLVKKKPDLAEELFLRDVEDIKTEEIQNLLDDAGIDPSSERTKNLQFQEVYPGYFTVVDPSLAERLREKGARYLYSTADNAERVLQMLTGGQKSSFTRFQEGILVQGKSSSRDFETGGAFSVFTRLVTKSVIDDAKRKKRGEKTTGSETQFRDWGGSRPYKLIINRRVLSRLDWYGYNGDNFGRTTNLTGENHTEKLIQTISNKYSSSNELMFPVGNDPAFVDFVVCTTEEQKDKLVEEMTKAGVAEINGKPLDELIRVGNQFFQHPEDMTVEEAVLDRAEIFGLEKVATQAEAEFREELFEAAIEAAKGSASELAKTQAAEEAPNIAKNAARDAAEKKARKAVKKAAGAGFVGWLTTNKTTKHGVQELKVAAEKAALETAEAKATEALEQLSTDPASYELTNIMKSSIEKAAKKVAHDAIEEKGVKEEVFDGPLPDSAPGSWDFEYAVTAAARDAAKPVAQAVLTEKLVSMSGLSQSAVKEHFEKRAAKEIENLARSDALAAATEAAVASAKESGLFDHLLEVAEGAAREAAEEAAKTALKNGLASRIKYKVENAAKEAAKKLVDAKDLEPIAKKAAEAAKKPLTAAVQAAADAFKNVEQGGDGSSSEVTEKMLSSAMNVVEGRIEKLVSEVGEKLIKDVVSQTADEASEGAIGEWTDKADELAKEAVKAAGQDIVTGWIADSTRDLVKTTIQAVADKQAAAFAPEFTAKNLDEIFSKDMESMVEHFADSAAQAFEKSHHEELQSTLAARARSKQLDKDASTPAETDSDS